MNSFSYVVPTKVIFGTDALSHLQEELEALGVKKVLVLYGGGSVVKSGVLDQVTAVLKGMNQPYLTLGGIQPNPLLSKVHEGRDLCLKEGVDFLLPVGGGSTIDTAKAISLAVGDPEAEVWDFFLKKKVPTKRIPLGAVLTISAAGSETSDSGVITNGDTKEKRGIHTPLFQPNFCLLNPEFTYTLPKFQISCGIVDILMHTLDRYFSAATDNELTDQIAEGLLRTVLHYGKIALDNPKDYKAMSELMWCGSISHNGLTGLGCNKDFSTHRLGRDLSGIYDSAHGATLSVAWVGLANFVVKDHVARFARYGRKVFDLEGSDQEVARQAIDKTAAYFQEIEMPITLTQLLGFAPTDQQLEELTMACLEGNKGTTFGTIHSFCYEDVLALYKTVR